MGDTETPKGERARPRAHSVSSPGLQVCLFNSTSCRQKLVYDYSEEVDKEFPDADPWLPAWTPKGSDHGD